MRRLMSLFLAFILFGWVLPRWGWALCPMLLGILMFLVGLRGILASSGDANPASGLGGVVLAFLGVSVALLGLGMSGNRDLAERFLRWSGSLPTEEVLVGSFVVGFVLAALAGSSRRQ
jgi:hypothetical protein